MAEQGTAAGLRSHPPFALEKYGDKSRQKLKPQAQFHILWSCHLGREERGHRPEWSLIPQPCRCHCCPGRPKTSPALSLYIREQGGILPQPLPGQLFLKEEMGRYLGIMPGLGASDGGLCVTAVVLAGRSSSRPPHIPPSCSVFLLSFLPFFFLGLLPLLSSSLYFSPAPLTSPYPASFLSSLSLCLCKVDLYRLCPCSVILFSRL